MIDREAYHAASTSAVLFDRGDQLRMEVRGPDRVKFLHNVTTNDIKRLADGEGREAFVTSIQGRTLALVTILARPNHCLLRTDAECREPLSAHFARYGAFDDVAFEDVSGSTAELHVAGPLAGTNVARLLGAEPASEELCSIETTWRDAAILVVRESPTGRPGLTLLAPREIGPSLIAALNEAGLAATGDEPTWEVLRIEAGTPRYGREVTPERLPQELARDLRAISFIKGCYLGQETVARLDALGHVNRLLRGLALEPGPVPPPGSPLEAEGRIVGAITSSAESPGWGRPIALAYVRTSHADPGQVITVQTEHGVRPATVFVLPMVPDGLA
jgi:folate-binding protein YgfZ